MIHYLGTPIWPQEAATKVLTGRHAFVSFEYADQVGLASEVCSSFALDCGAFTAWTKGRKIDIPAYYDFVEHWMYHPSFDWAVIPDFIDGTEQDNDDAISEFTDHFGSFKSSLCVPVYHLHEPLERLIRLSGSFERIALGSSGPYAQLKTADWWNRMAQVMDVLCDRYGRPRCKIHGFRMLDPEISTRFPFASADSTNVATNVGKDSRWKGTYTPATKSQRALVLADRTEFRQSAALWSHSNLIGAPGYDERDLSMSLFEAFEDAIPVTCEVWKESVNVD